MPYDDQKFPSARVSHWGCAPQVDRMTGTESLTSVCYFQVPADPVLGGTRVVVHGGMGGGRRSKRDPRR